MALCAAFYFRTPLQEILATGLILEATGGDKSLWMSQLLNKHNWLQDSIASSLYYGNWGVLHHFAACWLHHMISFHGERWYRSHLNMARYLCSIYVVIQHPSTNRLSPNIPHLQGYMCISWSAKTERQHETGSLLCSRMLFVMNLKSQMWICIFVTSGLWMRIVYVSLVPMPCGSLVPRLCGSLVPRLCGSLVPRPCGSLVPGACR